MKSRARVLGEDLLAERHAAAAKAVVPKLGELIAPYLAARKSRRSRKLGEAALVQIWQACADDTYGPIVKLLILTGQRREEIGGLQWSEIDRDERWIELPEERCKNHRRHLIPLSEPALAILEAMPRKEGEHMFGRHGAGPFIGWALAKKSLEKRIAAARKPRLAHKTRARQKGAAEAGEAAAVLADWRERTTGAEAERSLKLFYSARAWQAKSKLH